MRFGDSIWPDSLSIDGDGNNRHAEPGGNVLDRRIGDRLDAKAAADWNQRRDRGRDRLSATAREHEAVRARLPPRRLHELGCRETRAFKAPLRHWTHRRANGVDALQPRQRFANQHELIRNRRKIELEVDGSVARLATDRAWR